MRSVDPSSRVTVPAPAQTPAMPANGPDWARPTEPDTVPKNNVSAAAMSSLTAAGIWVLEPVLLTRSFPAAAAWYACRRTIPFSGSGIAAELAICMCTTDRNLDETFPPDAARNISARRGNLSVGDSKRRTRLGFAAPAFCYDGHVP